MTDQRHPDELAQLRAEVARLRAKVERPRLRLSRRFLPVGLLLLLMTLMPLATFAANPFTDLVPGSVHNPNIDAIYNAGITTGCVPNEQYCPTDFVTRQEMASFLARTAGLGGNAPVVNAAQLGGSPASAFVRTTAAFAHTVTPASKPDPFFPNYSVIDNPLTNGKPNALLFVTQNWEPNDVYNAHEVGVFYVTGMAKWAIFNEDLAAIPEGSTYNVLVIQP
jgi:hypothetical protein